VVTLNGANTYTGTTTSGAGTLAVGIGGSISGSTAINNTASFDVSAQNATPFSVASTQTLTNNGTVTGNLSVAGTLKGNGSVSGNVSAVSGGTVAPGNSTDIMTVGGNFSVASSAHLAIEIGGTTAG